SRMAHRAAKLVAEDIERIAFNKGIARLYELVNAIQALAPAGAFTASKSELSGSNVLGGRSLNPENAPALRQALEMLVIMIAPMMPHLADECWSTLGGTGFVAERPWPVYDPSLVVDSEIVLPVQVNGKKRGDLTIARDADQGAVEKAVLALDFVQKALEGKAPRKVIIVPQRIVNVVA
ncbi:leucine--tRNA ligase, partial [Mesorhizobium sp. M6A.T.Ca.TU.002.02.2.1]